MATISRERRAEIRQTVEQELREAHIRSLTFDLGMQADRIECLEKDNNFMSEQLDAKERIIKALLRKEDMVAVYIRALEAQNDIQDTD